MRENRLYGSEGGGPQTNAASLPLSLDASRRGYRVSRVSARTSR
jgi:hypothetical protein